MALLLALAAGTSPASAQILTAQPPSSVSYVNSGRYLIFQGSYVNDKGNMESGLIKFDSQTGLTWMLRPAPATHETAAGFNWIPIKN